MSDTTPTPDLSSLLGRKPLDEAAMVAEPDPAASRDVIADLGKLFAMDMDDAGHHTSEVFGHLARAALDPWNVPEKYIDLLWAAWPQYLDDLRDSLRDNHLTVQERQILRRNGLDPDEYIALMAQPQTAMGTQPIHSQAPGALAVQLTALFPPMMFESKRRILTAAEDARFGGDAQAAGLQQALGLPPLIRLVITRESIQHQLDKEE